MNINDVLYIKEMEANLKPTFIIRMADLETDECPQILAWNPNDNTHTINCKKKDLKIPFFLEKYCHIFSPGKQMKESDPTQQLTIHKVLKGGICMI